MLWTPHRFVPFGEMCTGPCQVVHGEERVVTMELTSWRIIREWIGMEGWLLAKREEGGRGKGKVRRGV